MTYFAISVAKMGDKKSWVQAAPPPYNVKKHANQK